MIPSCGSVVNIGWLVLIVWGKVAWVSPSLPYHHRACTLSQITAGYRNITLNHFGGFLKPYPHPDIRPQPEYNVVHTKTRARTEMTIGGLHGLRATPHRATTSLPWERRGPPVHPQPWNTLQAGFLIEASINIQRAGTAFHVLNDNLLFSRSRNKDEICISNWVLLWVSPLCSEDLNHTA